MTKRYDFKDGSGNSVIPVSDASFFTDAMSVVPDQIDIYVSFYSDASGETPATPTAGTITAYGEYLEGFFLLAGENPTIDATEVIPGVSTYTPPTINGCTVRSRIDLSGVTGVTHMRAFAYKRS